MSLARPRVLVADDHPTVAKVVCRLLAPDCEIVGTVADGSVLLEAVRRLEPDVIVLDVNLPGIHALEACRQLTDMASMRPSCRRASDAVPRCSFSTITRETS